MKEIEDLTGKRFGSLTVQSYRKMESKNGRKYGVWECLCDCGGKTYAYAKHLKNGHTTSCGCARAKRLRDSRFQDLSGQKFGRLTVIEVSRKTERGEYKWLCRCECGNMCEVTTNKLKSGHTKSCGCYNRERTSECSLDDLTGKRFGYLEVKSRADDIRKRDGKIIVRWNCICDCGNETVASGSDLKRGHTKSCGCKKQCLCREVNTTHGESRSRLYHIWRGMISRCENKNEEEYARYGGRGINVCNEWRNSYVSFRTWAMESGYKDNLTIDRIDNDGNYEPSNCQWLTKSDNVKKMFEDKKKRFQS